METISEGTCEQAFARCQPYIVFVNQVRPVRPVYTVQPTKLTSRCCPGQDGITAAMFVLNEAVPDGKPLAGEGVDNLLS